MRFGPRGLALPPLIVTLLTALSLSAQPLPQTSSSSSKGTRRRDIPNSALEPGSVSNGAYRNKTLGVTLKIPDGWVLRTDEMNAPAQDTPPASSGEPAASSAGAKVLLAAFSRPPEAKGDEVNASILIAAESASAYPGLKEAVQYFDPLTEVAKAQGFAVDAEPYEIEIGARVLVRSDFHKDVNTRVMRQSTLAMLSHGYAVSITVIAGTEDQVEELLDGLQFQGSPPATKSAK